MPRAKEAMGVRRKLASYSLNASHADGGPKARGFSEILGITIHAIDYLEGEVHRGVLVAPIAEVRNNRQGGVDCVVEFPLRGLGEYRERMVTLRTIWRVVDEDTPPRLVSAWLRP